MSGAACKAAECIDQLRALALGKKENMKFYSDCSKDRLIKIAEKAIHDMNRVEAEDA